MNRINNYVLNGAIALLSTAGFVACSSSDDVTDAPVNPTYDGKSVKTQFAINIATPSNGKTRMSDVNTQNKSNYLGMANVRLLTLADTPNDGQALLSALALGEPTQVNTSNSSHIYKDVNIPLTTRNFLFYSTRKDLGTPDKAQTGAIVSNLFANNNPIVASTNDISFSSEPIVSGSNSITVEQNAFANYLNNVVATKVDDNNKWSSASETTTLGKAYKNFIKTYSDAQRAGSAEAVKLQMQALYNIAKPIADNSSATDNALAQKLCENILNSSATGDNIIKFEFNESNGELNYVSSVDKKISNFPCEQGLPEGAALLTLNGSSFSYNNTPVIGSGNNKINISKITYPLPIVYFDNTPAKANNAEISDWKNSTSTWDTYGWTVWDDVVSATTRSIALQNNINYGVAGLKTVVKCEAAALEDNRNVNIPNSGNQSINVPSGGFEVTGILIGGQPNTVNWQFIDANPNPNHDYVVYDKVTNGVKANASAYSTNAIYTLVFDNWTSKSNQEKVTFALELKNGDVEFYGQEGVIAAGQKFYLIGQLDPSTGGINWPTYPDSYSGADDTLPKSYEGRYPVKAGSANNRVFVQDFTTTAQVNIKSLKNAYVTIPDLRATQLQLGLSVDLSWRTGLTYDVTID